MRLGQRKAVDAAGATRTNLIAGLIALAAMRAPQVRATVDLNASWEFARVPRAAEGKAELTKDLVWNSATLPHAGWTRPLGTSEIWQGVLYYRRHLEPPPKGRRAVLSIQGMQHIDLWLNGRHIAERYGGYLPLRTQIEEGGELLVRVDNRDDPMVPPGKPQSPMDFMYGNGLVGNASLEVTDPLHFADCLDPSGGVWIRPELTGGDAVVNIRTVVRNDGPSARRFELVQTIVDPSGRQFSGTPTEQTLLPGAETALEQKLTVRRPSLWSPDSPTLYRLRTSLRSDGKPVDDLETPFGIRTIQVSREKGFVLNGNPLRLVGTNRHQDYPWVGPAFSDAAQWRDALMIKRSGHNIVRLSHYNQSPAFLYACDRLGILTIPCIPGWQHLVKDPLFLQRVDRDIRETVRRDRNHPSVAWWETSLNETYPRGDVAREWDRAAKAEGAQLTGGDEGHDAPWDVAYNGWQEDLSRPSHSSSPGYIREYGDYEFGGARSTTRARIGDGLTRLLEAAWNQIWSYNKFRPQYPSTMGAGTWEMFDHNVPWEFPVSASGLADLMRREKPGFWFYASQEARRPYLKIATDWQPGKPMRTIIAFTNADRADLFVNGRRLKTATAERGKETSYDLPKMFDGTNTANLPHPPIVFRDIPFEEGELKVLAANGASAVVRTAGRPVRLKVWVDDLGIAPTANDRVFVRAAIVDAHGIVCPTEAGLVRFSGATFAGEDFAPCEMGVASVLVRTSAKPVEVMIRATSGNLSGACRINVPTH